MTRTLRAPALAAGLLCAITSTLALPGCGIVGAVGGVIENVRRESTRTVEPEYTGIEGKSYAVLVTADRGIQADHPGLLEHLTNRIDERLRQFAKAGGRVPPEDTLRWLSDNPRWPAMPRARLAEALGKPDRLILVELTEYRLNDPGNQYLWDGVAAGTVTVFETDGTRAERPAFRKAIEVKFPGKEGYGPNDLTTEQVTSALALRFIDRSSWLFYTHEEPYYPEY
jgi:hypothetical protein